MSIDVERLVKDAVRELREQEQSAPTPTQKKPIERISLEDAKLLAARVEEKAREMGVRAVVAIADEGGNLKLCECMDDSYIASRDIAINKAYTSVALKMSTKKLSALAAPGGSLYGIQHTNGGRIVIFGGGDTLELRGRILGALGVSGGTEEQDTALSAYGKKVFGEYFS
ncbi:MAG: heme-binding protein [Clostridia bacterium]|nr:heme-binding protein [Clostridia bacterium]MBQ5612914.1 heme-binding protein [Clostridia bacterium]MBQ5772304.1 heme-binding protein [Clostridia bacterium]MBQ5892958.1 heme-binding protein [Clostridia bacterium]